MNNDNKYLNEEKYQKNKNKLKKVAKILFIVGGIVLVLGLISFIFGILGFSNTFDIGVSSPNVEDSQIAKGVFGSFGLIGISMFLFFIGTSLLMFGGVLMFIAHGREINTFTTQSTIPVAKEGIDEMAPTIGNVSKEITKGIKEGLNEEDKS